MPNEENDTDNLVGSPPKSFECQLPEGNESETIDVETKNVSNKEIQADLDIIITEDDLTNPEGPSEKYWLLLSRKRLSAFNEASEEHEQLLKIIEQIKEENVLLVQMLDEANSFLEVLKEELNSNSNDDTGIDVNDVSTADETADVVDKES